MLILLKIVILSQIEFPELSSDSESDISDVSIDLDLVVYFPEPEQHNATPLCVTERRVCSVAQVRKSSSCDVLCIVNCKLKN